MKIDIDAVFMCNDDIRFRKSGWDVAYLESMQSPVSSLGIFNPEWKEPSILKNFKEKPDLVHSVLPERQWVVSTH